LPQSGCTDAAGHSADSPTPATGKSLLVDATSTIVTGRIAPACAYTSDEDEMTKRLVGVLLRGDMILNIDNIAAVVSGQLLCQMHTQSHLPSSHSRQHRRA
jgi:hypothetical protein